MVYNEGNSKANRYLVLYYRKNDLEYNRLGISVSKKVGNSVVRHRTTRLIRESYRLNQDNLKTGYDMVRRRTLIIFLIHSRISFFRNVRKWKNCVNWIENKKKKMSGTSKFSRNLDVPDIFTVKNLS